MKTLKLLFLESWILKEIFWVGCKSFAGFTIDAMRRMHIGVKSDFIKAVEKI